MKKNARIEYDRHSILFLLSVIAMFLIGGFYIFNGERERASAERKHAERLFKSYMKKKTLDLRRNSERYLSYGVAERSEADFMALKKDSDWEVLNGWRTKIQREDIREVEENISQEKDGVIYLREGYYMYSGARKGGQMVISFWEMDENFLDVFYSLTGIRAEYGRRELGYIVEIKNHRRPVGIDFPSAEIRKGTLGIFVIYTGGLLILLWVFNRAIKVRFKEEEGRFLDMVDAIRESRGNKGGFSEGDTVLKRLNQALIDLREEYYHRSEEVKDLRSNLTKTNLELRDLVISDSLTGVYNKSFMYEVMEDLKRQRIEAPYHRVIMMIDLDNFKKLNDSEGHLTGDRLLMEVGELLKGLGDGKGRAFRYGGDEFFLIFSRIKYEELLEVLEDFERKKLQLIKRYLHVKLGISAGVVVIDRDEEIEGEKLIKRVDDLLYKAKQNGKNQIVMDN